MEIPWETRKPGESPPSILMSATTAEALVLSPEDLAHRFLQSLQNGKLVDALDTLAPDAVVSDGEGPDRHGLREIATSLLPYRTPDRLVVEGIRATGGTVNARVRVSPGPGKRSRRYNARIDVRAGRIRAVDFQPA